MTTMLTLAGRYRLIQPLDQAQTIWQARDDMLQRDVTVRLVDPAVLPAVRAATKLRQPSVVTIHDVVTEDGRTWVVTELLGGGTLTTAVPLGEARIAALGLELLDALSAAHALGIAHGGVQPDAVVQAGDGRLKLSGFGTTPAHPMFTPPEGPGLPAADLWSLAATLFLVAEGRPAFPSAPALRAPRLAQVLLPMLAQDPAARPDAAAFRRGLRKIAPRAGGRPKAWQIRPVLLGVGAAVLTAVVAPVAVYAVLPDGGGGSSGGTVFHGVAVASRSQPFPGMPDTCKLLTDQQATLLVSVHDPAQGYAPGNCSWHSTYGENLPGSLTFSLDLRIQLADGAKAQFDEERRFGAFGSRVTNLAHFGDGAFLSTTTLNTKESQDYQVTVHFRLANAVVELQYSRRGRQDPRMDVAAEEAARWVGQVMSHA